MLAKYAAVLRWVAVIAWAAWLGGCATTASDDAAPRLQPGRVETGEVPGFTRSPVQVDPNPQVGTQTRYFSRSHEELVVDVFVYDGGFFPDSATAATHHLGSMRTDVDGAANAGIFSGVQHLDASTRLYEGPDGPQPGAWLRFAFDHSRGGEMMSHAHVFYVPPYTIKFRSSFPSMGNRSFDEELERVVRTVMKQVVVPRASK